MAVAIPTPKEDTHHNDRGDPKPPRPRPKPPRPRPQKPETLDRRIRNLEAIEQGVFTGNTLASFMALPGLVGFWPMSSVQRSTGNAYDLSGQGRTLTYNGNPAYSYYNGLMPYIDLDGTGDFLSRADETDLDILGNESIYTTGAAGLTLGGWFWADTLGVGSAGLIGKYTTTGNQRSYLLFVVSSTVGPAFIISGDGTATDSATHPSAVATGGWFFAVGVYIPSTSVSIFVNSTKTTNSTSIPATIFNSTAALQIGAFSAGTALLDGRAALCFLCANALSDELITSLYSQSKPLFGL
jgi:hypothetical protein